MLRLFSRLDTSRQASLRAFAGFLYEQQSSEEQRDTAVSPTQVPADILRPDEESVVAAMRRLTRTFPMIDRDALLDKATSLMTSHMLQGKPAAQVIDELDALFREHYQRYLNQQ